MRDFRRSLTAKAADHLLKNLGGATATRVRYLLAGAEYDELCSLRVHPRDFTDPDEFRRAYLATSILRKIEDGFKCTVDKTEKAKSVLASCEARNRETNIRLRKGLAASSKDAQVDEVVWLASRKILYVLGDFDPQEWFDGSRWGPGVSQAVKGQTTHPAYKFGSEADITPSLHAIVGDLLEVAYPAWFGNLPRFLTYKSGNEVTFVNKDATVDRSIGIEPGLNLWFQLGIGQMIRRRLKQRVGIDLNSQRENQAGARVGSIIRTLVTADHENASNLNAFQMVRTLVVDDTWFDVMDAARSKYGTLDGVTKRWEMFSSMGNGFTFELETLIFWAVAAASCDVVGCDPAVRVFGDDVVIPSGAYPLYRSTMEYLGHRINEGKTFSDGAFRESCGVHYWDGVNCAPFYLKETCWNYSPSELESVRKVNALHNRVVEAARAWSGSDASQVLGTSRDVRFEATARLVRNRLPSGRRFVGPARLGDAVLHVDQFDVLNTPWGATLEYEGSGWEGFWVKGLAMTPVKETYAGAGLLLAGLHSLGYRNIDPSRHKSMHEAPGGDLFMFGDDEDRVNLIRNICRGERLPCGNQLPQRENYVVREHMFFCQAWDVLGPWAQVSPPKGAVSNL